MAYRDLFKTFLESLEYYAPCHMSKAGDEEAYDLNRRYKHKCLHFKLFVITYLPYLIYQVPRRA